MEKLEALNKTKNKQPTSWEAKPPASHCVIFCRILVFSLRILIISNILFFPNQLERRSFSFISKPPSPLLLSPSPEKMLVFNDLDNLSSQTPSLLPPPPTSSSSSFSNNSHSSSFPNMSVRSEQKRLAGAASSLSLSSSLSSSSFLIITLLFIFSLLSQSAYGFNCGQFDTHMGATFDLRDLERTPDQPSYAVEDGDLPCTTQTLEKNYTYMFNICGTLAGGIPPACLTLSGLNTAGALQVDKRATTDPSDDWCWIAGAYSDKTSELKLLDEEDPTKGLKLTYFGDYCNTPRVQRQFNVELACADKLNPVPLHAYEYSHCVYTVSVPSVYGCPLECPVAERKLCGGNGHCSYDRDKGAARCFCNKGYSGVDCMSTSSKNSSNYSPVLLGLIITLFIIIAILGGSVVLMIRQVSAYRDDMTNYHVLKGGDDDGDGKSAIV